MIIIDTDVLIEIVDKKSEKGEKALRIIENEGDDIAITVFTLHEILYGLMKYAKPLEKVLALETIEFKKEDAKLSAELELKLEREGIKIPRIDSMIAAMAFNRKAKLFTFNKNHFKSLKKYGLRLL